MLFLLISLPSIFPSADSSLILSFPFLLLRLALRRNCILSFQVLHTLHVPLSVFFPSSFCILYVFFLLVILLLAPTVRSHQFHFTGCPLPMYFPFPSPSPFLLILFPPSVKPLQASIVIPLQLLIEYLVSSPVSCLLSCPLSFCPLSSTLFPPLSSPSSISHHKTPTTFSFYPHPSLLSSFPSPRILLSQFSLILTLFFFILFSYPCLEPSRIPSLRTFLLLCPAARHQQRELHT